jgi:hypothetical protein
MKQFDYNEYRKNNPLLKEDVPSFLNSTAPIQLQLNAKLLRNIPEEVLKDFYSRVKEMESEGTDLDSSISYAIYDMSQEG